MKRLLLVLAMLVSTTGFAAELRFFTTASLESINTQFAGRPFILILWSTSCTHCAKELRLLGKLVRDDPALPLAIVSTDTPDDARDIHSALQRFGLDHLSTWVFADNVPERLRHAIDPAWRGELPRTYLFDVSHRRTAHSGALNEAQLKAWLRQNQSAR